MHTCTHVAAKLRIELQWRHSGYTPIHLSFFFSFDKSLTGIEEKKKKITVRAQQEHTPQSPFSGIPLKCLSGVTLIFWHLFHTHHQSHWRLLGNLFNENSLCMCSHPHSWASSDTAASTQVLEFLFAYVLTRVRDSQRPSKSKWSHSLIHSLWKQLSSKKCC